MQHLVERVGVVHHGSILEKHPNALHVPPVAPAENGTVTHVHLHHTRAVGNQRHGTGVR